MKGSQVENEGIEDFREQLRDNHYSVVLIDHLIHKIDSVCTHPFT